MRRLVLVPILVALSILFAVPASATVPLTDWGGPIVTSANVHVLYWGTSWTTGDTEVNAFVPAFVGSTYVAEANEYERGGSVNLTYSDTSVDTSSSPSHSVRYPAVRTELVHQYGTLDESGIYIVVGDTYGSWGDGGACAWHDYVSGQNGGPPIPVEYVPNDNQVGTPSGVAACMMVPGGCFLCNYNVFANRIAHETLEVVTDPQPCTAITTCPGGRGNVAWDEYDGTAGNPGGDGEIGDLCVENFAHYTLTDGSDWYLQQEWSNVAGKCV